MYGIGRLRRRWAHGGMTGAAELEQLRELLRLVLTSAALSEADRERAAVAVHEVAGEAAAGPSARSGTRAKLQVVRDIVGGAADIVRPATNILNDLGRLIGGL